MCQARAQRGSNSHYEKPGRNKLLNKSTPFCYTSLGDQQTAQRSGKWQTYFNSAKPT